MGRVMYATREEVMDAFDIREAAHRSAQVDAAISGASDEIDAWLNRHKHGLAPRTATLYFPWPIRDGGGSYRLWLDENTLVSATSFTAGGTSLTENTHYFLEPVNSGPPYTYVEINLNSSASLGNSGTFQRAIAISGVWGVEDVQDPAGSLVGAVNASVTALQVSDGSLVGVGSVLLAEDERILVTGRSAVDSGDALTGDLDALDSDRSVTVADGSAFHVGEVILVNAERMKITDIAGNTLVVNRAWDGSVLTAHTTSDTVFTFRSLTVERGALGTTAASHSGGIALTKWRVPPLVRQLARASAITALEQEFSAYGARVYSDEAERDSSGTEVVAGRGLTDVRRQCARRYKRKFRKAAV